MNKSNIVREISKSTADKKEAELLVSKIFELIKNALKNNEKVMISGFGTFKTKSMLEKQYYNPKTKEKNTLPPRKVIRFKVSKKF
jgi:nucleoid DNA-binding protein